MWKDIDGFDGRYEISDSGEIRNKHTLNILTLKINKYGYQEIGLRKKGDRKKYWSIVHRLVAEHFIENKPENWKELQVDHIDHNKSNNNVINLRFTSCLDNCLSRELKTWATNKTTGELYITKYKTGYMIRINRSDYKFKKWETTLENAIIERNKCLAEIKK